MKRKKQVLIPPVRSLLELRSLAAQDERYRRLLFIACQNLSGPMTQDQGVAYRWLEMNALETDEAGVVEEVNFCRDLIKKFWTRSKTL